MTLRARELAQIVSCHKRKSLIALSLILAATWLVLAAWPRMYRSEAVLLVRVGRESVALDPTATVGQTLMLQKSQEDEVNSALNILSSYQVAAEAVDAIGSQRILGYGEAAPGESSPASFSLESMVEGVRNLVDSALWAAQLKDPVGDRELAIMRLQNSVNSFAAKNSMVITIHGFGKTPQLAQQIVAEVTKAFMSRRIASTRIGGSREFFDDQVSTISHQLEAKTAELAEFRQTNRIISISANREVLKEQLSRVEQNLAIAGGSLRQAEAEVAELEAKIAEVAPEIVQAKTAATDSTWSGMRQALYSLQIEEKQLSQVFTASHPKLIALRDQVREAEQVLKQQTHEAVDKTTTPNPLRLKLIEQLMTAQTSMAGFASQVQSLEQRRKVLYRELDELVKNESQLTQLEREHALLESDYNRHAEKQQEARVIEQMEADQISNVGIVQPATFVEKPVSPQKKIIALGGLFLALAGTVGVALAAEAARTTFRTSEHAEEKLGVPVLVTMPKTKRLGSALDCLALEDQYHELRTGCRSLLRQLCVSASRKHAPPKTIGVLSCTPGAGGSTTAAILAVSAANDFGFKSVLVNADDLKPAMLPFTPRVYTAEETAWDRESHARGMGLDDSNMTVDSIDPQASLPPVVDARFANPQAVYEELHRLSPTHDVIIVDLPAATAASGGAAIASMLDCVVLVVEADVTDARTALQVRAQLERSQARLAGIVLNKAQPEWSA